MKRGESALRDAAHFEAVLINALRRHEATVSSAYTYLLYYYADKDIGGAMAEALGRVKMPLLHHLDEVTFDVR